MPLPISFNAYETPLIFDLGGERVTRLLHGWCAAVFVAGCAALAASAVSTSLAMISSIALGASALVLMRRAQAASNRYDRIIVTARGDIGVIETTAARGSNGGGAVCAARLTGRNLCLPGLWLLEVETRHRQVVVVPMAGRSGWDRARLRERLLHRTAERSAVESGR